MEKIEGHSKEPKGRAPARRGAAVWRGEEEGGGGADGIKNERKTGAKRDKRRREKARRRPSCNGCERGDGGRAGGVVGYVVFSAGVCSWRGDSERKGKVSKRKAQDVKTRMQMDDVVGRRAVWWWWLVVVVVVAAAAAAAVAVAAKLVVVPY